jgi:hypothetical protein
MNGHISSFGSIAALNVHPDTEPDDDWQVYMAIASKEECMESVSLAFSIATDSFSTVRELFNTRWKDYHSFRKEAIPLTIETPELAHAISTDGTKQGVIATRSYTARLRVAPRSRPDRTFDIINAEGDRIGELCGDAENLREQVTSPGYDSRTEFEFIALSLSGEAIRSYQRDKLGRKNYTDVDGNSLDKVPIVNVLMIANNGGFARRRELGWAYLKDWARLQQELKVVVLE